MKLIARGLALVGLLAVCTIYYQNSQEPELGVFEGRLKPLGHKPNDVSTQTSDPSKKVETLPFKESLEATKEALIRAVQAEGTGVVREETDDYIYVVFTTPTLRFNDDAEFWLDEENELVHFRSAARAGYSDMGNNRRRYQELRRLYTTSGPE